MVITMNNTSIYFEEQFNIKFSGSIAALIDSNTKIVRFPRGQTVVHEGDAASHIYMIVQGIVRGYYIDADGNDVTKCFSLEGEFFSSEGFRTVGTSSFTIECVKDCTCISLPYVFLHELIEKSEQLKALINTLYARELGRLERRSQSLLIKDAEERYNEFIREYPDLIDKVPLKHIASYIGIRAASLSRIRKKLLLNLN